MLVHLILSNKSLQLFSHFFIISFCCSGWNLWLSLQVGWSFLLHQAPCWTPLVYFLVTIFFSSVTSICYFLILPISLLKIFVHPFFTPVWWASLWTITLNSSYGKLFVSISLRLCSLEVLSLGTYYPFLHIPGLSTDFYRVDERMTLEGV